MPRTRLAASLVFSVAVALMPALAVPAAAQPLPVLAGHARHFDERFVRVTGSDGVVREFRLVAMDAAGLRVRAHGGEDVIPWDAVARVETSGDPIYDGFFKGMAIGGGLALFSVWMGGGEVGGEAVIAVGLSYGLIGALVDGLHVGTTTLYVAPSRTWAVRSGRGGAPRADGIVIGARIAF